MERTPKKKVVFSTSDEVVDFIVRSTDEQLKDKFGSRWVYFPHLWDEVLPFGQDQVIHLKLNYRFWQGKAVFIRILDPATKNLYEARLGTDSKQSKRALDIFGMVIEANKT